MTHIRTYDLLQLSTKSCRRCAHFKQLSCSKIIDDDISNFAWSSLSTCDIWTPNEVADEALQILTMRKLTDG
jgi:hypothetical protein